MTGQVNLGQPQMFFRFALGVPLWAECARNPLDAIDSCAQSAKGSSSTLRSCDDTRNPEKLQEWYCKPCFDNIVDTGTQGSRIPHRWQRNRQDFGPLLQERISHHLHIDVYT